MSTQPAPARIGPSLTVAASCQGCAHEVSEHYSIEDGNDVDSGCNVYCTHPEAQQRPGAARHAIGDTTWKTPPWCPLLASATAALVKAVQP